MKRKLTSILITFSLAIIALTGCDDNKPKEENQMAKIVKTEVISQQMSNNSLDYIGLVKAKDTKKYSFLMGGKIEKIYVKEGDFLKAGSPMAKLDTQALQYTQGISANSESSADAAVEKINENYNSQIIAAENNIKTIKNSINTAESNIEAATKTLDARKKALAVSGSELNKKEEDLEKNKKLLEIGGISQDTFDNLKTQFDNQKATYDVSVAQYNSEENNINSKRKEINDLYTQLETANSALNALKSSKEQDIKSAKSAASSAQITTSMNYKNIKDATLYADSDCYVISISNKEGENISPNVPIVTVKGKQNIVTVGVSNKDINKINKDSKVLINDKYNGTIDKIAQYPNENSMAYDVDIIVGSNEISAGETVNIKISIGSDKTYYVPIIAIFNSNGVDYVYAVNDENRVYKKEIEVIGVDNEKAKIKFNINKGESKLIIITDGINNLNENDLVKYE